MMATIPFSPKIPVNPNGQWVLLAVGSNIKPRKNYIQCAISKLVNRGDFAKNKKNSRNCPEKQELSHFFYQTSLRETKAWGKRAKSKFLNGLILILSKDTPEKMLLQIKNIEKNCGRSPDFRWADREIDIDLLLYGKKKINLSHLSIPHPGIKRDFLKSLLFELYTELKKNQKLPLWEDIFPNFNEMLKN